MKHRTRVLVVDDSAFARKVMREVVGSDPDFEIAGHARDGLEALEQIERLEPDLVTLDLMMPELDGLGVLRALAGRDRAPRVVVVSSSAADGEVALEALALGAVDVVHKPTAVATARLYDVADDLLPKLRVAAAAQAPIPVRRPLPEAIAPRRRLRTEVILIGTSTGGPQALAHIASRLGADLPVPVFAVVHIPVGYTTSLAARLDGLSALSVVEADEGLVAGPGTMVVARAGMHLALEATPGGARCRLGMEPARSTHRPSVDVLFATAAAAFGSGVLAAVCTGMGDDGLIGARAIRDRGGRVLAEAASSCVVDGMPRAIREAGLADGVAAIEEMAAALVDGL